METFDEQCDRLLKELNRSTSLLTEEEKKMLLKKAESEALHAFYKSMFLRQYIGDFMTEGITPLDGSESNAQKVIIDRARNAVVTKPPFALITINPYPVITLDELTKAVNKFKKRKIIDAYAYVYEVRKEDFTGLHCHMIVKYNCKPYDLKRNVKSTFKNVCDESNPSILNIKYIEEQNLYSKLQYIKGNKKDAKMPGVTATKEYRFQNNLCELYESTPPIPCRGAELLTEAPEIID